MTEFPADGDGGRGGETGKRISVAGGGLPGAGSAGGTKIMKKEWADNIYKKF